MKTNNKKRVFAALTAGFLAITPVMTAGMSALVANAASITVNQKQNDALDHNYYAYALIKGTYTKDANQKETLSDMQWNTTVVDLEKLATALNSFDGISGVTNTITPEAFITTIAGIDPQELTRAFITYGVLKTDGVQLDKQEAAGKTTGYKKDNLDAGWYLIVDKTDPLSTGSGANKKDTVKSANLLQVIGDETIDPKFSLPSIDKKITSPANNLDPVNGKFNSAAIGDTVKYEITIPVPDVTGYDKYYYIVDDTLSKGLTYTEGSLKVKLTCNSSDSKCDKTELTLDADISDDNKEDYYVTKTTLDNDGGTQIKVVFQDALTQFAGYHVGDTITITYDAVLNENAVITDAGNPNTAKLVYSNDPNYDWDGDETPGPGTPDDGDEPEEPDEPGKTPPTGETPDSKVKTYTTAIQILKVDQDGKPLTSGVEFTLTGDALNQVVKYTVDFEEASGDTTGKYYKLKDGKYTTTAPVGDDPAYENDGKTYNKVVKNAVLIGAGTSETTIKAVVDANGYITFYGLNAGSYKLSETQKPAGYNSISDIEFTIGNDPAASFDSANWTINVTKGNATFTEVDDGVWQVTIENRMGSQLPETGGLGTKLFYLFGGLMVTGSVVLLVTKKRMSAKES